MKRLFLFCLLALLATLPAVAQQVTLQWSANTETDLAGYKVYFGMAPRVYGAPIAAGLATNWTVTGLTSGLTYYFAVTAFNASGLESGYSNEVSTTIPIAPSVAPAEPNNLVVVVTVATASTTAAVAWRTSMPSDAKIDYGTVETLGKTLIVDTAFVTDHLAKITGLMAKTIYYYRVTSKDVGGQIVTATGTFQTK